MRESYVIDNRCIPEVERMLRSLVSERRAPSYAYGIFSPQGLLHSGTFGKVDTFAPAGDAPGDRLRFRIASMSKSFTAAAVLTLVAQGRVDLHEPIVSLIPEMSHVRHDETDSFPITVADLLSMRSGLATDDPWADRQESMSHETFLELLSAEFHTVYAPGEGYEYSNLGYAVLGELIRRVSGMDPRDYVRHTLLDPLELQETTYDYHRVDPAMLVYGHHLDAAGAWEREPFSAPGAFSAIGGVLSSVHDVARWCTWLAQAWDRSPQGAQSASDAILPRRYRRLMQIGHTAMPTTLLSGSSRGWLTRSESTHIQSYGFGLIVEHSPRFGNIAHHSGGYPGYGSHMRWHLSSGLGIVVLANGRYATPSSVASRALDLLLETSQAEHADSDTSRVAPEAQHQEVAGNVVQLWPETVQAMHLVCKVVQAASLAGGGEAVCLQAMNELNGEISMNVALDQSWQERAQRLAALLAVTGPVSAGTPPITDVAADSAAQLSWTLPCERHPLRCSIRLNPLDPPQMQTLTFAVADAPATDDITVVEPRNAIIW